MYESAKSKTLYGNKQQLQGDEETVVLSRQELSSRMKRSQSREERGTELMIYNI